MGMSEWPDDDASEGGEYPPAPLPAHERTWRHPSELGRAVWTHTEPPLTIGRGLLITTGAIGGLLSIAVLWAMLPSAGRGGIAAPTVVASTANDLQSTVITSKADTLVATSVDVRLPPTTVRTGSTNPATSDLITSTSSEPAPETVGGQGSELVESTPVAVGVGDSLVITTARAVRGRTTITLMGNDGQPHDATVLMVDRDRGLAVLSADAAASTTSYGIGPAASPGDVVTVMGSTPTSASVSMNVDGRLTLDTWGESTPEGTPVVNADGLLVGICSHASSGNELVSVASVAAMLAPVKPAPAVPWLGVHVVSNATGALTIDWVSPDGPSAAVGLAVGDVVTAIDGVAVASVEELKAAIGAHAPADVITLTVTHADQTSTDVAVTLGTAPSM
jgi:S1-C subfamily serine protease